ncbi:cold-inducible RNA-binding protein [Atractiella rhizophila]|nr:cold-inducible RNA-binding protein [Atractiella rhizophila]
MSAYNLPNPTKLFIGNLSFVTSHETLRLVCLNFGSVLDLCIMKDQATGKLRGYGFVTYRCLEDAEMARRGMNGMCLDERVLTVDYAK